MRYSREKGAPHKMLVIELVKAGLTQREIAERLGIRSDSVGDYLKRHKLETEGVIAYGKR